MPNASSLGEHRRVHEWPPSSVRSGNPPSTGWGWSAGFGLIRTEQCSDEAQKLLLFRPLPARKECSERDIGDMAARCCVGLMPHTYFARCSANKGPSVPIRTGIYLTCFRHRALLRPLHSHHRSRMEQVRAVSSPSAPDAGGATGSQAGWLTDRSYGRCRRGDELQHPFVWALHRTHRSVCLSLSSANEPRRWWLGDACAPA